MSYHPLAQMITTGPAQLSPDGTVIASGESVAALYEAIAAERETEGEYRAHYMQTAHSAVGALWMRDAMEVFGS